MVDSPLSADLQLLEGQLSKPMKCHWARDGRGSQEPTIGSKANDLRAFLATGVFKSNVRQHPKPSLNSDLSPLASRAKAVTQMSQEGGKD